MFRPTNGFDRLSIANFIETLNVITGKMKNNPYFPDQQTQVTALFAEQEAFLVLAEKAVKGGKTDLLHRDAKRTIIVTMLHNLGFEVAAVAKGDLIKLESSGFDITKVRQPTPALTKPEAPKVFLGVNTGEIECVAKKQMGTEHVNYMLSTDPQAEGSWKMFSSSKSRYLFTNLVSGQRYFVKYSLAGVRNQEVYSDTVSYISQ